MAVYARQRGHMKDTPAWLAANLTQRDGRYLECSFPRVINNNMMLRNLVQIIRSGEVERRSMGEAQTSVQIINDASVLRKLSAGGTNCAVPLANLNRQKAKADVVIYDSDKGSSMGVSSGHGTATMPGGDGVKGHDQSLKGAA